MPAKTENLKVKRIKLSEIARIVLGEEVDNPIVKNIKTVEDFDTFLDKPENKGEAFYKEEFDVVDMMDIKPNKKLVNQIKYSKTDEISSKNKELVIIKKQKKYLAFSSVREPADLSAPEPEPKQPVQQELPLDTGQPQKPPEQLELPIEKEEEKDTIFIKVSKPFEDQSKTLDVSLLSNFLNALLSEFQV
jgi:hypothetical protein